MHLFKFSIKHLKNKKKYIIFVFLFTFLASLTGVLANYSFTYFVDFITKSEKVESFVYGGIFNMLGGYEFVKSNLYIIFIILVIVYIIRFIFFFLRYFTQTIISSNLNVNLKNTLYSSIAYFPFSKLKQIDTGEILQKCTSDVDLVSNIWLGPIEEVFYVVVTVLFSYFVLFSINVKLAIIGFIPVPLIFLISFFFQKKIYKEFELTDEIESKLTSLTNQTISNIRVVKAFNNEKYEYNRFSEISKRFTNSFAKFMVHIGEYWSLSSAVGSIGELLICLFSINLLLNNEISIGNFILFITYQKVMLFRARQLGRLLNDITKTKVAIQRINSILDEHQEDLDKGISLKLEGDISFKNVSYKYPDGNAFVLQNLNFDINKGSTVAIIGKTGSGKSALIELIDGLDKPTSGHIYIDNTDIINISKRSLRSNIALIMQEPFVFSKSIKENINITEKYDDDKITLFTKISCFLKSVMHFKDGFNTIVGEKGITLSGGQKQRLCIARTLIDEKPILIFDDSLSAVDNKTDQEIRNNLKNINQNITKIIITSRIASCIDADNILVLDNGKIVEQGTHKQLLENEGFYRRIFDIQNEGRLIDGI